MNKESDIRASEAIRASIFEVITQINNLEAYYYYPEVYYCPQLLDGKMAKMTREADLVRLLKKLAELRKELTRTEAAEEIEEKG